jgi:GrpB-like predicted nucleotidyltransferase (UPF0157 family)
VTDFLQPYNPEWETEFESLKRLLLSALEGYDLEIQHVGSTAIPGLTAKPILDIDIIIDSKPLFGKIAAKLEGLGYINKGEQGILGRFAFRQASNLTPKTSSARTWQAHHLYICFSDSLALKNHLLFREALRKDKELSERYGQLKVALMADPGMTKEAYTRRKTDFILSVLKKACIDPKELNQIKNENS